MVRDSGALRHGAARTSGTGAGGVENARPGVPKESGAAYRPPLRAIQPPASGAPWWSLPAPRKGLGVRGAKAPAPTPTHSVRNTSLALRKPCPKLPWRTGLTRSVEVPGNKVRDAISLWEKNSSNVQKDSSTLQYSDAPPNVQEYSDEDLMKSSEDILKLQLEFDIFKIVFVDELKASLSSIEYLESDVLVELKKSNEITLEILDKRNMEISRLQSELDNCRQREYLANKERKHNDESCRQAEFETAEVIMQLEQQLKASSKNALLTKENLNEVQLEKKKLNDRLVEVMKENNELRIDKSLVQLESTRIKAENQCSEAQVFILKGKLETTQQLAEKWKAYAEEKGREINLLERSLEDQEITVCELENKAKHERMRREEVELKLENIQQQKVVLPSFVNASSFLEDERVNLLNSIRRSQDIQNDLLGTEDVSENKPEGLGPVPEGHASCMTRHKQFLEANRTKPNPCPTMEATKPHIVGAELVPLTEDPDEPIEESSLDEGLQEPKETVVEMEEEEGHSSDEDYGPEISEFEQPSPNEHPQQYSITKQPELHRFGVQSDQSQSESRSEEQLSPPSVEPVVEIVEENDLPPFAVVRHNDPVNYMRAPSDELKRLRNRNHYEGQRTATDRRFWSIEQQDLYTFVYSRSKLANMKSIDWEYIDNIEYFRGVRKQFAQLGLEHITSCCCHWNSELIRQFYSTVYISADKTSMTWMSDGRKITTNKRAWEESLRIPGGHHTEIHSELFLNDDAKRILYTAAEYTLGTTNGLSPLASTANKILKTTMYPRFGNRTHSWNVLYHIVEQHPFDIIALIFGEIDLLISDHNRSKDPLLYAPYIMAMIMAAFEYEGPRESCHQSYRPRQPQRKPKLPRKACPSPSAAGAAPAVVSLEPEATAAGHQPHVEAVNDQNQSEAAGHQAQVEAIQRRGMLVQPITHSDLVQVVENGLKPMKEKLASMEGRIGRVENGASVLPQQHINSSCSSQILAPNSTLAPSFETTTAALPRIPPATSPFSEQPSVVHGDCPGISTQPVRVTRPSPFSGFHWYKK